MIGRHHRWSRRVFHFIHTQAAEITHLVAEVDVVLFVSGFFGRVGGKYQALAHLFNIVVEFCKDRSRRKAMGFIGGGSDRVEADHVQHLGATYAEQNELRDLGRQLASYRRWQMVCDT